MDIHPPHPIHSFKDFLLQILTITVGILIALGLEQGIESLHNHHLVREARTNIVAEMKANRDELEINLPMLKKNEEQLRQALGYVQQLKKNPKTKAPDINLNLNFFHP